MGLIADEHRVARYCGQTKQDEYGGPAVTAFFLRKIDGKDEEGLSVNWVEYFGLSDQEEAMRSVRAALERKGREVGTEGIFALLRVGDTRRAASPQRSICFRHDPVAQDCSHTLIVGYQELEDMELATVLKEQTMEVVPVRAL